MTPVDPREGTAMTPHARRVIVLVALTGLLAAVLVAPLFQR